MHQGVQHGSKAAHVRAGVSHQGTKSFLNDTRASLGPLVRGSVRGSRMTNRGAEPPPSNIHRVTFRTLSHAATLVLHPCSTAPHVQVKRHHDRHGGL